MKKKLLCMIVAVIMVFSLAACSSGGKKEEAPASSASSAAASEESSVTEPASEPESYPNQEESSEEQPEMEDAEEVTGVVLSFDTKDVHGADFSSADVFGGNKITMVNFWASWCPPCVAELPDLQELNEKLGERGCGVVGVLLDGTSPDGIADGIEILDLSEVKYINLIPWDGLADIYPFSYVPTSFFVDSEGKVLCEPIVGAQPDAYLSTIDNLLANMD